MNPLSFLRRLDYPGTKSVLVVQTAPASVLPGLVARLREVFPGCAVELVVRAADAWVRADLAGSHVEVVGTRERLACVARLRRRRYDAVVVEVHPDGPGELRALPYFLRTRAIIAFNENLDHFPLNLERLETVVQHFGLLSGQRAGFAGSIYALTRNALAALVVPPARFVFLVGSVGWLYVRGALRRWRPRPRQGRARAASAVR